MIQLNLFALPILRKHDGIGDKLEMISLYAQAAAMMMVGALAGASVLWLAYKVTKHLSR
jgi:predicted O-methyltransferase YrrM